MTMAMNKPVRPPLESMRESPFALVRDGNDDTAGDGLTLDGYGAVFNRATTIDSWEGRFRETIAPGSMKRSFRETPPKIQFDHGRHPLIGSIPIAELRSISEDIDPLLAPDGGAHVVGRVFDNWLMTPVRDAIAAGAINGMSFRFAVKRESWHAADGTSIKDERALLAELSRALDAPDDELPIRTLKEVIVSEVGPVTWPAYSDTSVSVRSAIIDLGRLHEPEQRRLLADAVFLADAASIQDDDPQRDASGEQPPAVERPPESDDAQRTTPECVGERPSESHDAQRDATDESAAVERPSQPRGRRPVDILLRRSQDNLLDIESKGKKL